MLPPVAAPPPPHKAHVDQRDSGVSPVQSLHAMLNQNPVREATAVAGPCEMDGGQSGTATGFSPSTSVIPCQYHSTNDPHSYCIQLQLNIQACSVAYCVVKHFCVTLTTNWERKEVEINLLKPTGHVVHQQFNIQQLYSLPTLYLCVLYLSENKQRLVPLTA